MTLPLVADEAGDAHPADAFAAIAALVVEVVEVLVELVELGEEPLSTEPVARLEHAAIASASATAVAPAHRCRWSRLIEVTSTRNYEETMKDR
jgi:hypothetical protein